jgi:hypothetical protein
VSVSLRSEGVHAGKCRGRDKMSSRLLFHAELGCSPRDTCGVLDGLKVSLVRLNLGTSLP